MGPPRTPQLRRAFEREVAGWIEAAHQALRKRYGRVWGMDLGTSKSAVAVFDAEAGAAVICPHRGHPCFPSTLALDKQGNELVGLSASEQLRPDLRGCIERSKRAMGTRSRYKIGEHHFSPEEVAARLIGHGRGLVEAFLRELACQHVLAQARAHLGQDCPPEWLEEEAWAGKLTVTMAEAVVTIPAYFNFEKRRATRDAAEIAGIKVHRLIPEPTAACLSAGLTRELPGKILVVDLGAGTLDLSYLEARYLGEGAGGGAGERESVFEVEQIFGDSQLGAGDFDAALEAHFLAELAGAATLVRGAAQALGGLPRRRLRAAVEELKIALSSSASARQELVAFAGHPVYALELTAARLEELLAPLLDRLERTCRQAAGLRMDHLVLVGGPMFSPLVRRRIEQVLQRKADVVVDPRTAVAMGAAYQAALLSEHARVPFALRDIVPFALGVLLQQRAGAEGAPSTPQVSFHIPRGTRIPHQSKKPYTTFEDHQAAVKVEVFHGTGESTAPEDNTRLAMFHLEELPPAKAGELRIDVTFDLDANGLLEITAEDDRTKKRNSVRVEDALWLSPLERTEMAERMSKSQRWADERAELARREARIAAALEQLQALAQREDAAAWQRQFAAWQRQAGGGESPKRGGAGGKPFAWLATADQALFAEMYNQGQLACDEAVLALDRAHNLQARGQRFLEAARQLGGAAVAAAEQALRGLKDEARQLEEQLRATLAVLGPLLLRFQRWSAALAHHATALTDPRARAIALHEAGQWQRAAEAHRLAFAEVPAAEVPAAMVQRHLDSLARQGDRERYRAVLAEQKERLALHELHFDRLNEFGRHVRPAIAWVFAGAGTGSGFLAAPDLVVTNRHVIFDDDKPVPVASIKVQVGGANRQVVRTRLPASLGIDLAILQLASPIDSAPVRVGYSGLVEVGERVLAIGFPMPEGDSFEENLLLDHGIVNRIRTRAGHGRELELGLKLSPGMSGGPVFNDRGEVIAVSTFVRYQPTRRGQQGPFLERSAHAITVDTLHELLPRPW